MIFMNKRKKNIKFIPHNHKLFTRMLIGVLVIGWVLLISIGVNYFIHRDDRQVIEVKEGVTFMVNSVNYSYMNNPVYELPKGYKFAIIDISLINKSSYSFNFAPTIQMYVTDAHSDNSQKYYMSPTELNHPITAGKVAPKTKIGGEVSFAVPDSVKVISVHFNQ